MAPTRHPRHAETDPAVAAGHHCDAAGEIELPVNGTKRISTLRPQGPRHGTLLRTSGMAKRHQVRNRRRKEWIPEGESIGASLVGAAVRALETHGGRPEIRRVAEHVETIDMTHSMFGRLQREDFLR